MLDRSRWTKSKPLSGIGTLLRELYEGEGGRAVRFRYGLLLFDVLTIIFLVATSFVEGDPVLELIDATIGLIILADFVPRLLVSRHRFHDLLHPLGLADIGVIISFIAPISGHGLGFLRALRALRLFRSYRIASRMQRDFPFVRRNYDTIVAGTHLFVFLFVMTAIVYETQHRQNPAIGNYIDALYFTVATLTTTGFGDITLTGTEGRVLSIVMMIVGITCFCGWCRCCSGQGSCTIDAPHAGFPSMRAMRCTASGAAPCSPANRAAPREPPPGVGSGSAAQRRRSSPRGTRR